MPCQISITSILGTPVNSTTTNVVVSGTASRCAPVSPNPSPVVNVIVSCGGQVPSAASVTVDQFGNWTVGLPSTCLCGQTVNITATCSSDATCFDTYVGTLPCNCCPKTGILPVQIGSCDISGNRPVTLDATIVVLQQGCTPITVQWDFGDGNFGPVVTYNPPGTYTLTGNHSYSPGTYFATVLIISPTGCQPVTVQVVVPPCPTSCCPLINTNVSIGNCQPNGDFMATFATTITVNQGCPTATVEWDFGDGNFGGAQAFGPGTNTFTQSHTYNINNNPAPPYTATLNVIAPSGCTGTSVNITPPSTDECDCYKKPKKLFCNLLSQIFTYGFGFALVLFILASCLSFLPNVQQIVVKVAAIAAVVAAAALTLYLIFCNKCLPCGWFWLFLWRIFFGAGIILLIFSATSNQCSTCANCQIHAVCSYFNTLGWIFTLAAFLFLTIWIIICSPTLCDILKEVFTTWAVYILPIVAFLQGFQVFQNCQWVLFAIGNFHFTFYMLMVFLLAAIFAWWQSLNC